MGITCCKGMRDILPAEMDTWYYLESIAFRLVEAYGYKEIRTPLFESRELFTNCLGRDSSVIQKNLWTLKGQSNESWALRPEMTASIMRAYCEHRLDIDAHGPTKLFYTGPVFLHGHSRQQFCWQGHQLGLDALGTSDPASDTEVIMIVHDLCRSLGLPQVRVSLNTLGCAHCRSAYQQMLSEFFSRHSSELCDNCRSHYKTRPLWTMSCHEEGCHRLASIVPSIYNSLCEDCETHFKTICDYLSELKVDYVIDPMVVRDVDYYNRTIFRVSCADRLVAFGGRYDGLATRIMGGDSPLAATESVGCSIDVEPLLNLIDEFQIRVGRFAPVPKVCLAGEGQEAVKLMLPILYALRRNGIAAVLASPEEVEDIVELNEHTSARFVLWLKNDDVRSRNVMLCDNETRNDRRMSFSEALLVLEREFGIHGLSSELRPMDVRHFSIATRNHHGLDGNSRLRKSTDGKLRTREYRRNSIKTHTNVEQLLGVSLRDGRARKNSGNYQVASPTMEKLNSRRVRKRRRPENEDSLEMNSVDVSSDISSSVYLEPLTTSKRENKTLEMVRPVKGSRRSNGRNGEGERFGYGRSMGQVERFVYSQGTARKRNHSVADRDLVSLCFDDMNGQGGRSIYDYEGDELLEAVNAATLNRGEVCEGARSADGGDYCEHCEDNYGNEALADGDEKQHTTIIDDMERWASERYGIELSDRSSHKKMNIRDKHCDERRRNTRRNGRNGRNGRVEGRDHSYEELRSTYDDYDIASEPKSEGDCYEEPFFEAPYERMDDSRSTSSFNRSGGRGRKSVIRNRELKRALAETKCLGSSEDDSIAHKDEHFSSDEYGEGSDSYDRNREENCYEEHLFELPYDMAEKRRDTSSLRRSSSKGRKSVIRNRELKRALEETGSLDPLEEESLIPKDGQLSSDEYGEESDNSDRKIEEERYEEHFFELPYDRTEKRRAISSPRRSSSKGRKSVVRNRELKRTLAETENLESLEDDSLTNQEEHLSGDESVDKVERGEIINSEEDNSSSLRGERKTSKRSQRSSKADKAKSPIHSDGVLENWDKATDDNSPVQLELVEDNESFESDIVVEGEGDNTETEAKPKGRGNSSNFRRSTSRRSTSRRSSRKSSQSELREASESSGDEVRPYEQREQDMDI